MNTPRQARYDHLRNLRNLRIVLPLLVVALILSSCYTCTSPPAARLSLRIGLAKFADYDPFAVIDRLHDWGFDYCEPAVLQVMTYSDDAFAASLKKSKEGPVHVEVMNWFVPKDVPLTGPAADPEKIRDYVERSLARAEALGAEVIVFGSPFARSYPEGFPREKAWAQLVGFLRLVGGEIDRKHYGMTIGIEPLRRAESNIVNTVAEALKMAREVGHPRVKIIVDFFHFAEEHEDPGVMVGAREWIVHLHISNPNRGRVFPRDPAEEPRYAAFFETLRKIGYRGRISLEANTKDLEADAPAGAAFLRRMAEHYR